MPKFFGLLLKSLSKASFTRTSYVTMVTHVEFLPTGPSYVSLTFEQRFGDWGRVRRLGAWGIRVRVDPKPLNPKYCKGSGIKVSSLWVCSWGF